MHSLIFLLLNLLPSSILAAPLQKPLDKSPRNITVTLYRALNDRAALLAGTMTDAPSKEPWITCVNLCEGCCCGAREPGFVERAEITGLSPTDVATGWGWTFMVAAPEYGFCGMDSYGKVRGGEREEKGSDKVQITGLGRAVGVSWMREREEG